MKSTLFKLFVSVLCGFAVTNASDKTYAQKPAENLSTGFTESSTRLAGQEDREKAVVERFWTILTKNPRRGTSLDRVYGYYVDAGQIGELVEKCRKLTRNNPQDAKTWLLQGLILSRRGDDDGTVEAFQKAESLDVNDALGSFYLGETFIAQGRLQDAAAALERAIARKPSRNDILNMMQALGRVYERFGDKEKSAKLWSEMEKIFPNDSDILVQIAETLEEEGKYDDALRRYQKLAEMAAAKKDNYARVRFALSAADIKIRTGKKQDAINDFEKLLDELAGDNWLADSVRDRIERVFVRQADYAGLTGYYQKRLAKYPNDAETTRRLATALVRLGRTDDAKELLIKILEKAPSNAPLRLALIDLYVNDRNFDEADKQYALIDKQEPNNPDTISQWGLVTLENRKLPERERKAAAAKIWLRLLNARPNDVSAIIMVADLMTGGKIHDEAEKLYQKAVELAPNDPSYREYLGLFYHRTEQKEKAVATLRQIAEGTRRTAANLTQLGSVFKGLGYAEESREALKAAAELAPKNFDVQFAYLGAEVQSGDFNAVKTQFQRTEKLVETDEELQALTTAEVEILLKTGELANTIETLEKAINENHSQDTKSVKDLWRLAVYSRAAGEWNKAVSAIEKAIQMNAAASAQKTTSSSATLPLTLMILGTAANIFTQTFDEKRAAEIYERLASADAAHRVDHLKRLANLQRDMGQSDQAIETARLVMASGSGNAANSRFYAEMLFGVGRRSDGIEALRRAVRIDPADQVSLTALAEQLAQNNQLDEAIEIAWRIFDRTEDLQGKIGQIGKLSNYYQQGNRFDQLIARLRRDATEIGKRRNAAYCLAQAHVAVGDYFAARNALEMLLTNVDDEKNNDTFLLDQLSRVAEMQGDLAAAIRYQEMLCDQKNQSQDRDRLLGLYYAAGERNKAASVYLQITTSNVDFADQIKVLDKLIAREDYKLAQQLLERIEIKHSGNWELLYRKMELTYWLAGKDAAQREQALKDAETIATSIFAINNRDDELSVTEQKASQKTAASSGGISGAGSPYRNVGSNYSAWGFGRHQGHYSPLHVNFGIGGNASILQTWNRQNHELIQTLFRERLQLEQYYYQRGSMASSGEPEKPLFKPLNFGDAKFAAQMWRMKFAYDLDLADFEKNHPEEAKLLKESGETRNPIVDGVVLQSRLPQRQTNNSQTDKEKAEIEKIEKALTFERLLPLIEKIQKEFPDDSNDKTTLQARLRFETYLNQQIFETAMDDEIIFPPSWETRINTAANNPNSIAIGDANKIIVKLGLLGEKEWKNSAFRVVLQRAYAAAQLEFYESHDKETLLAEVVKENKKIHGQAEKNYDEVLSKLRKQLEQNDDGITNKQRLDWLLRAILEMAESDSKQLTSQIYYYDNLMSGLPTIYHLLEQAERQDDAAKLDDMIERLAENMPQLYMIGMLLDGQESLEKRWRKAFFNGISVGQILPLPVGAESFDEDPLAFEKMKKWTSKMKNAAIKNITENKPATLNAGSVAQQFPPIESMLSQAIIQYASNKTTLNMPAIFGSQRWQNALQQSQHQGTPVIYSNIGVINVNETQKINNKIDKKELETIAKAKEEFRRVLDYYLAVIGEIKAAEKNTSEPARAPTRIIAGVSTFSSGRGGSFLANYRDYFQGNHQINANTLQNILQQIQMQAGVNRVVTYHGSALGTAKQFMKALDLILEDCEPDEGVTKEQIQANNAEWLKKYLDEKSRENLPGVALTIQQYRDAINANPQNPMNPANPQESVQNILISLEKEYADAKEKGENFPHYKLITLALIYKSQNELAKAAEALDAIPFVSATDVKTRETIILQMYQSAGGSGELKKRAEQAINRLLGYQLATGELMTLRTALVQFDRKAEADAIRDRLIVSATDLNTMGSLFNELQNNAGNDGKKKEQLAQYALKLYRSPALSTNRVLQTSSYERHLRDQAIHVLQNAGKLGEIVEQIESQWKSSPGSMEITLSLMNIYSKAGRKDDAKKLLEQLKTQIPDDAQKMIQFAQTLRSLGEKKDAAEWMNKGLAKKPEAIFQGSYWEIVNFYREIQQEEKFLEFLKKINYKIVLAHVDQFAGILSSMKSNARTKKQVYETFDTFWRMKEGSDAERRQIQRTFVDQWIWNADAEMYPYFREVVLETIAIPVERSNSRQPRQISFNSIHQTRSWSSTESKSLSYAFLNLAEKNKALETLKKEIQEAVAAHEKVDENIRNWTVYFDVKMLEAMIDLKTNDVKRSLEIFKTLKEKQQTSQYWMNNSIEMPLVQLLENQDDLQAVQLGIELCERSATRHSGSIDTLHQIKLAKLYLKSDREKGREKADAMMKSSLNYLKLCAANNNGQVQIGNNYYSIYELSQNIQQIGNLLKEAGEEMMLLKIYGELCEGQTWYETFIKNQNWKHYSTMVRGVFDLALEKTSAEEMAVNIEMFIPRPQTTDQKETAKKADVPLFLGIYRKSSSKEIFSSFPTGALSSFQKEVLSPFWEKLASVGNDPESDDTVIAETSSDKTPEKTDILPQQKVAGALSDLKISSIFASKLFDALAVVAKTDVEKFAALRKSLDLLEKENPDDLSVALTKCRCAIFADEPAENIAAFVKRCAELTKSETLQKQSDESLCIGAWLIAREIYTNPEKYDAKRFADDCKTLTDFAIKYIVQKLPSNSSASTGKEKENAKTLQTEIQTFAPKEIALKALLLQNSQLTRNLNDEFYNIRDQYVSAVKAGGAKEVLAVFESFWANGWDNGKDRSSTNFDRYEASQILWIFDAVYNEASGDRNRNLLYESLKKIVFTDDVNKPLFFGIYNDLGGPNGRFKSLMGYLLESANHTDELYQIIEAKRKALANQPKQLLMLDAMELNIALIFRNGDEEARETIQKLTAKFLKLIRDEKNADAGVLALIVLAEFTDFHSPVINSDELELLNAALKLSQQGIRYSRYAYNVIRRCGLFLEEGKKIYFRPEEFSDSFSYLELKNPTEKTIETSVDWAELYRNITREANILNHADGFRTMMDDWLLKILEQSIDENKLTAAFKILKYFASEPKDSRRYRDLGKFLDSLKTKLDAWNESKRNELLATLGNIKFEEIARESTMPIDVDGGKPKVADDFLNVTNPVGRIFRSANVSPDDNFDLPKLPTGNVVYEADFENGVDKNWNNIRRDYLVSNDKRRAVLGEYSSNETPRLTLKKLPPHQFLRIRFDLYFLEGIDGIVGYQNRSGVDTWEMKLNNGIVPIGSTFSNFRNDPYGHKQTYPDDYPPLFNRLPSWYNRVIEVLFWDDTLETGFYFGREGAAESNTIDAAERSSVYAIDIVAPHTEETLEVTFATQFQDGPYENTYNLSFGECWGLDNFRVETLNEPLKLTDEEMKRCFDVLLNASGVKANAARWRLVAAGDATTDFVAQWSSAPESAAKLKEITASGNILGFRLERVLQLIHTQKSETLRQKLFEKQ
ncbi:MAG: tetratricopeptide repeat protein [Planctomycetaceae bacterium]|jgi:tetratricopeptide (TPR) repeat protein|nr:tetratricopeptide repeat protein [Planctomycetaceae bacterium]